MKTPPDGWDEDEQRLPDELTRELASAGPGGEHPPIEVLRAAGEGVLPKELDASAQWYLARHERARDFVNALNESAELDPASESQLFARITREAQDIDRRQRWSPWRWQVAAAVGAVALLGSALWIAQRPDRVTTVSNSPAVAADPPAPVAPTAAPPTFLIPLERPDLRISLRAMTWRGQGPENPVLVALKPAFDAYRAGDYATADREFAIVAQRYPDLIEVALYRGVSQLFLNDWSGAAVHLNRAQAMADPAFAADVAWYLAIAEERAGDAAAARQRLQALCDDDRSSRACQILADRR